MAKEKKQSAGKTELFAKENYILMLAGIILLAAGFFLMAGGKSNDPNVFDPSQIHSTSRTTVAPILIIAGFLVEIMAIMRKPKKSAE